MRKGLTFLVSAIALTFIGGCSESDGDNIKQSFKSDYEYLAITGGVCLNSESTSEVCKKYLYHCELMYNKYGQMNAYLAKDSQYTSFLKSCPNGDIERRNEMLSNGISKSDIIQYEEQFPKIRHHLLPKL